jgi:hypothetical protein
MQKEFIPYKQALELKELGFNEESFNRFYTKPKCKMFGIDEKGRTYPIKNIPKKLYTIGECCVLNEDNVIISPLYQQAFRWFREKYDYAFHIDMPTTSIFYYVIDAFPSDTYDTYEEAELACIIKLIEIVKEKKD